MADTTLKSVGGFLARQGILVAFAVWGFVALDPAVTVPLVAFGLEEDRKSVV